MNINSFFFSFLALWTHLIWSLKPMLITLSILPLPIHTYLPYWPFLKSFSSLICICFMLCFWMIKLDLQMNGQTKEVIIFANNSRNPTWRALSISQHRFYGLWISDGIKNARQILLAPNSKKFRIFFYVERILVSCS